MNNRKQRQILMLLKTLSLDISTKKKSSNSIKFICISSKSHGLRWIVPTNKRTVIHILANWTPYSFIYSIIWRFLCIAIYLKISDKIPKLDYIYINDSSSLAKNITNNDNNSFVIYVGTPSSYQKLVILFFDKKSGYPNYVAKIPLTQLAKQSIKNEYKVLEYLKSSGVDSSIYPHSFENRDIGDSTCQKWLKGSPAPIHLTHAHYRFIRTLINSNRLISVGETRDLTLRRYRQLVQDGCVFRREIHDSCSVLTQKKINFWLHSSVVHGDFVPWNLKITSKGTICALDWEYSKIDSLPCYDIMYYCIQVNKLLRKSLVFNSRLLNNQFYDTFAHLDNSQIEDYLSLLEVIITLDLYERNIRK